MSLMRLDTISSAATTTTTTASTTTRQLAVETLSPGSKGQKIRLQLLMRKSE